MSLKEEVLSIIKEYLDFKKTLSISILNTGEVPREICEICPTSYHRQFLNELTSEEERILNTIIKKVEKYKIISISSSGYPSRVSVESLRPIREICPNPQQAWPDLEVPEWTGKDEKGQTVYSYSVPRYTQAFKKSFLNLLSQYFEEGLVFCPHIKELLKEYIFSFPQRFFFTSIATTMVELPNSSEATLIKSGFS